jgi:hypothetical protein
MYDLYSVRSNGKPTVDAFIEAIIQEKIEKIGSIADSELVRPAKEWKNFLESLV